MMKIPLRALFLSLALSLIWLLPGKAILPAAAAETEWHARYWNNRKLEGEPVLQRFEKSIDYDWGQGSPSPGINDDEFSAKWTRDVEFPAGNYRFVTTTDDGMRVWIDEDLLIDTWHDSQVHTVSADLPLSPGKHAIRVEYYEAGGDAVARFSWAPLPSGPVVFNGWRGDYYNNPSLTEPELFVRDDTAIDFNWGLDAPVSGFNADDFSIRWTRTMNFAPGTYRFSVYTDDGVRLWVNNRLLIDSWILQTEASYSADTILSGVTPLKLEFFDGRDRAYIDLTWSPVGGVVSARSLASTVTRHSLPVGTETAVMTGAIHQNIRSNPTMDSEVIGHLSRGESVVLTGNQSPGSAWVEIRTAGGTGWVVARYLNPS